MGIELIKQVKITLDVVKNLLLTSSYSAMKSIRNKFPTVTNEVSFNKVRTIIIIGELWLLQNCRTIKENIVVQIIYMYMTEGKAIYGLDCFKSTYPIAVLQWKMNWNPSSGQPRVVYIIYFIANSYNSATSIPDD